MSVSYCIRSQKLTSLNESMPDEIEMDERFFFIGKDNHVYNVFKVDI